MGWSDERRLAPTEGKEWFTAIGKLGHRGRARSWGGVHGVASADGVSEQDILFSDAIDELFVHSDVEFISYEQEYSAS